MLSGARPRVTRDGRVVILAMKRTGVYAAVLGVLLATAPAWARGKIVFSSKAGNLDRMTLKASGVAATAIAPDEETLGLTLSNVTGEVFAETLAGGTLSANAAGTRWRYSAPRDGGIYDIVVSAKRRAEEPSAYSVKVRLEADLSATDPAVTGEAAELLAQMTLAVRVGDDSFVASDAWEPLRNGWRTRLRDFAARYDGTSKRVFVTSTCHLGSLGGLGGADAMCQVAAADAGLSGTFTAWLSDAHDGPAVRLSHESVPYVLVDSSVVARDWEDLVDGEITTPINFDETGTPVTGDCGSRVWTNTSAVGTPAVSDALEFACYEWTLSLFSRWGLLGDAMTTGPGWTDGGAFGLQRCSSTARLYCVER